MTIAYIGMEQKPSDEKPSDEKPTYLMKNYNPKIFRKYLGMD